MQALVSLYAPLDGLNEKGLAVSANMIQDRAAIHQDTGKPDITTTAVRLLPDHYRLATDASEAETIPETTGTETDTPNGVEEGTIMRKSRKRRCDSDIFAGMRFP